MCKVKITINNENDFSFLLSNLILSKNEEFTFEEILDDINKYKIPNSINKTYEAKRTLIRLRESGLISEDAFSYFVCA